MAKDDPNNYGPGSPTLTPESMTGNPADLIPGFMKPNPATGYPGAFNWAGAWGGPSAAAVTPQAPGGRTTYPEDLYQSGLLPAPAPAANPVPSMGPAGSTPPSPVDPRAEMLQKLTGAMTERGVGNFWNENPNVAGGALRVNEGPNAGKVYAFLEPGRQSRIENNLNGLVDQWASTLDKILSGESVPTGVKTLMSHGVSPAGVLTATSGAAKTPAEIANLESQAEEHTAQASLGPAHEKLLNAQAGWYGQRPNEHGANIGSMITNIYTHFMTEAAKVETDITMTPDQKKVTIASLEDRARQALNGVSSIMGKNAGGVNMPGQSAPMTASQFKTMAKGRGYSDADIENELKLLLSQGKITNG